MSSASVVSPTLGSVIHTMVDGEAPELLRCGAGWTWNPGNDDFQPPECRADRPSGCAEALPREYDAFLSGGVEAWRRRYRAGRARDRRWPACRAPRPGPVRQGYPGRFRPEAPRFHR